MVQLITYDYRGGDHWYLFVLLWLFYGSYWDWSLNLKCVSTWGHSSKSMIQLSTGNSSKLKGGGWGGDSPEFLKSNAHLWKKTHEIWPFPNSGRLWRFALRSKIQCSSTPPSAKLDPPRNFGKGRFDIFGNVRKNYARSPQEFHGSIKSTLQIQIGTPKILHQGHRSHYKSLTWKDQ